ncbi:MAG: hypothetical protein EPO61_02735 [Nitrospirae bacterium]|nr:MAG: hypothetical protein EPO61_02735 [Nitrospirota bacterium]
MALIKCPECGKEISSLARACPSCAYPIPQASMVSLSKEPSSSLPEKSKMTGETAMRFRNPATGQIVEITNPFL